MQAAEVSIVEQAADHFRRDLLGTGLIEFVAAGEIQSDVEPGQRGLLPRNAPSDPPPHPRLVGTVGIAELALQIPLLPHHDADIDHPHERHDEPDGPQASRRDA